MSSRVGQVWRFGDDSSGFTFLVVETIVAGAQHRILMLDVLGLWREDHREGTVEEWFEVKPFEQERGYARIA